MLKFITKNSHQHELDCLIIAKKLLKLLHLFSLQMDYLVSFLNHLFLVIRFMSFNIYLVIIIQNHFNFFYTCQFINLLNFVMLSEIINQSSFKHPFFKLHLLLNFMLKSFYQQIVILIFKSLFHFFLSFLDFLEKYILHHLIIVMENFYLKYYCHNLILVAVKIVNVGFQAI